MVAMLFTRYVLRVDPGFNERRILRTQLLDVA